MDIITQKEYEQLQLFEEFLEEKLILYSNGAKYGQVVFLAGGAASGKGFAGGMFMEKEKFKVRDIDEWKTAFIKLDKIKAEVERRQFDPIAARRWRPLNTRQRGVSSREIVGRRGREWKRGQGGKAVPPKQREFGPFDARELNLRKEGDVFKMHQLVKYLGIKEKTLDLLLGGADNPDRLPNIMFDVTLKDPKDLFQHIPRLRALGYKPQNIHLTWVLSNYHIALQANQTRDRIIPKDTLLLTHKGAAKTMIPILKGKLPKGMDGGVRVILNNRNNTIPWMDREGNPIKTKEGDIVIKDFTYLTVKKEGKPYLKEKDIMKQLFDWIAANVPKDTLTQQELDPER